MELTSYQLCSLVGLAERLAVIFRNSYNCCYPIVAQSNVVAVTFDGAPRAAQIIFETSQKYRALFEVHYPDENSSYLEMIFPDKDVRDRFMNLYKERGEAYAKA